MDSPCSYVLQHVILKKINSPSNNTREKRQPSVSNGLIMSPIVGFDSTLDISSSLWTEIYRLSPTTVHLSNTQQRLNPIRKIPLSPSLSLFLLSVKNCSGGGFRGDWVKFTPVIASNGLIYSRNPSASKLCW